MGLESLVFRHSSRNQVRTAGMGPEQRIDGLPCLNLHIWEFHTPVVLLFKVHRDWRERDHFLALSVVVCIISERDCFIV